MTGMHAFNLGDVNVNSIVCLISNFSCLLLILVSSFNVFSA